MADNHPQRQMDPEAIRRELAEFIDNYEEELRSDGLRDKVLALVPVFHVLRRLGKSLLPVEYASAARDRILYYFCTYPRTIIDGDELLVVSGIQEYARRIRELRVQFGWPIASGVTIREMREAEDGGMPADDLGQMRTDDYILLSTEQDRLAAHRWNTANTIRREPISVRDKILKFLRENIGQPVTGEELRYVAGNKTEWARRVRELRTEYGWPIVTKSTGRPDLPVGIYVIEADRQSPEHDRHIPDQVRLEVLRRDDYHCTECGWSYAEWNPAVPRHLELHHIQAHVKQGPNTEENLRTLCTPCHDAVHRVR